MIWREFELAAPDLARAGRERFERTSVALIGTLRPDGSPQISPVEPYFVEGHLLLGCMARSTKARDLRRDSRCSLHSSISDVTGSEGEFQLHGRAVLVHDNALRTADASVWWQQLRPETCDVLSVEVDAASLVEWDIAKGEMTISTWTSASGERKVTRSYP